MGSTGVPPSGNHWDPNWLISIYERAQEAVYHTDLVMWQVTAIIWGANVLMLGFVFEALEKNQSRPIAVMISIIGIVLTCFVARVCNVAKVVKGVGFEMCREVEKQFPEPFQLHTKINRDYPKGMARHWIYGICLVFVIAWLAVLFLALCPLMHRSS